LANLLAKYPADATILLVTHGQLIGNLAQHYGQLRPAHRPQNGSVAIFDLSATGALQVQTVNDLTTVF